MATDSKPTFPDELIDQLLAGYSTPEDLTGKDGILKQLTARLVERALQGEMSVHLGYDKGEAPRGRGAGNSRNGTTTKTLKTELGEVEIEVPRDRDGSFEPQLVKKRQTRFAGFDEKILALYARGMTVRDIQGHLEDLYGVEVSPDLISRATSAVMEDVIASGDADFVSMSRPLICEPDLPNRFLAGQQRALCISANRCWPKEPGKGIACRCDVQRS